MATLYTRSLQDLPKITISDVNRLIKARSSTPRSKREKGCKRYKAIRGDLPDPDVLKVDEVYQDFTADIAPLITTLAISDDVPLVDSAFGTVQEGSPISYQHPVPVSRVIINHSDAPPPPPLPLNGHRLDQSTCFFVCTRQQHLNLMLLNVTFDMAQSIEIATREQSASAEWHSLRKMRLTSSRFREVCHVQTALMKSGLALESAAVQEYARIRCINYWPLGFVIHPDAPWLGSSPDGIVFDPTESPPFGLVEVKCPNAKSYVDVGYLNMQSGTMRLKPGDSYYWQVQGQLRITGMQWCDFVVFAEEDLLVQRIFRDAEVAKVIREKGDYFFFLSLSDLR
ncbi:uncharacterized protein V6R79_003324 [Siganus canaliculatus]